MSILIGLGVIILLFIILPTDRLISEAGPLRGMLGRYWRLAMARSADRLEDAMDEAGEWLRDFSGRAFWATAAVIAVYFGMTTIGIFENSGTLVAAAHGLLALYIALWGIAIGTAGAALALAARLGGGTLSFVKNALAAVPEWAGAKLPEIGSYDFVPALEAAMKKTGAWLKKAAALAVIIVITYGTILTWMPTPKALPGLLVATLFACGLIAIAVYRGEGADTALKILKIVFWTGLVIALAWTGLAIAYPDAARKLMGWLRDPSTLTAGIGPWGFTVIILAVMVLFRAAAAFFDKKSKAGGGMRALAKGATFLGIAVFILLCIRGTITWSGLRGRSASAGPTPTVPMPAYSPNRSATPLIQVDESRRVDAEAPSEPALAAPVVRPKPAPVTAADLKDKSDLDILLDAAESLGNR